MTDNLNDIVVGLDIGTTKICAIVGRINENKKIEILAMGKAESTGVDKNEGVVNVDLTVNAINKAISQAVEKSKVTIKTVYIGIAGQHIKSVQQVGIITRNDPQSTINKRDIKQLVDDMMKTEVDPGEQIINVLPQEFHVDNSKGIKDPRGIVGTRLAANFHVITAKVSAVRVLSRCIKDANLIASGVTLEPLASSASVLSEEEMDAGVVLVDIGGGTTDLAIFKDGIIRHTAVIGYGGNIVTEDIKEGCGIMTKHAEILKVNYGCAFAQDVDKDAIVSIKGMKWSASTEVNIYNLSLIIQARMEDIIGAVKSHIFNAGFDNKKLIAGIVLTGGGSQLKHLRQLFEIRTGISTRIGFPTEHIANSDLAEFQNPSYSTAIGLIKVGYEDQDRKPNLNRFSMDEDTTTLAEDSSNEILPEAIINKEVALDIKEVESQSEEDIKKKGLGFWGQFSKTMSKIFDTEDDKNFQ
jgi:cell division protein FtsA